LDNFLIKNKVAAILFSYDDYIIRSVAMTEGVAFGFVRSDEVTAHAKAYKMSLILYK